ncbi:MAG: ribonuclease P protein component [Bacteroidetes bacterium]|nr:MAG: ribonuclease P protein component [Bacteroidota bacterium]
MRKQFTLGKEERLKSRKQIENLFDKGRSFVIAPFRIYYIVNSEVPIQKGESGLKFGVGVSAKNFRKAVDRNRIKRLTREAWRLQKNDIKEKVGETQRQLNVFLIYTGKELPDFTTVKDKVAIALKKLSDKIDENISANS